ncbi:Lambda phage tail tape-measure protein [compost metagenome]
MTADRVRELSTAHTGDIGSTRENTQAIQQLIASGKLLPGTYGTIAKAASAMSVASGESLDKIIEDFVSLGKEPLQAAARLNEKYDFLTASVYEQAKALVAQGKELEASKVLTDALAETMSTRSVEMIEHASDLAKAWHAVTKAISDTWTAATRASNPDKLMRLAEVVKDMASFEGDGLLNKLGKNKESYDYKRLAKERDELIASIKAEDDVAEASRKKQEKNRATTEAQTNALKAQQAAYTAVEKAQKELDLQKAVIARAGDALSKDQGAALLKPYETLLDKAKAAEASAAAAKTPKSATLDTTDVNELQNKVAEIKAQYKTLNETIIQQQNAGTLSSEAAVAKRSTLLDEETAKIKSAYEQQIAALEKLKGSKNISKNQTFSLDKQIADARSKMVVALEEAEKKQTKLAGDEKARLQKQRANVDAYSKSLEQMINNLKVAGDRDRAGLAQSSGQRELSSNLNSEDDRYAEQVLALKNQKAENPLMADEVDQKLKVAELAHTRYKNQILSNYDAMKVAQRDWVAGASSAYEQYVEDGQNAAAMSNELFTNAFNGMEDALVDFVTTGKLSFTDLANSILEDMARLAIRAAASQALTAMFGGFGGAPTSAGSTQAGYNNLAGWKANAKGSAYNGGTQFFAKGGAFTNTVVSKPTSFNTSDGSNNVMGEAGPEAIMPLTRSSDGSLGVRAQVDVSGLQQSAGSGVQVYINIDGDGNKQTSANDPGYSSFGNEIGQFVDQRYKQLIGKDLQPGGDIWKSMQS